jgi:CheY-like chemotaxis protein/HPt (histidine-containing phosphotransfer) domain-containing protein
MVHNRQQLIDARLRAEMAEKLQEEFLANMSHEIRTPMNGIIGMTNLLDHTELNSDQKEFVQLIRQSSDTLLMLINDILDLSKIKAGRMNIELIDFSLIDTVDRVLSPFKLKAAEKGIRIQKFIDPKLPEYLEGDQHKLIQILNNLVSNAVKFTESGSVDVYVNLINDGDQTVVLELKVEDTGIGIAPDYIDYIFESFAQAGSDMVRRFGGTGLGLAITKRLVELQGGTISVKSIPGKGSCFSFTIEYGLGVKPGPNLAEASGVNGNWAKVLIGKRVLLVEDNEINQKVTLRMLENQKMVVDVADNGKEGVLKLEKGAYDVIIMDLQMPVMDGFQTTTYIRNKLNLRTPIIAMTASALRNEHEKCLNLGMNVYMTKPFVPEELFRQLQRLLGNSNVNPEWNNTEEKVEVQEKFYDLSYLQELEDDEYMAEVLQIFLNTTPESLQIIKEQYVRENWEEVYRQAHKLKSSLGILQMNSLLKNISEIELLAKEQVHKEKVPELVKQSIEMYQLIRPMLEADLNGIKKLSA